MTVFIGIAPDIEFTVDKDDNLSVVRKNNWGVSEASVVIGPLTHARINMMQECLERLRCFAVGPDNRSQTP